MKNLFALVVGTLAGLALPCPAWAADSPGIADFQREAAKFNSIITIPTFETTSNQIVETVNETIAAGNQALDVIGRVTNRDQANFTNTIVALDDIAYQNGVTENRLEIIKETSPDAGLRDAAVEQIKRLDDWQVGIDYREDVYHAAWLYWTHFPKLPPEEDKLFTETMRDYRRAGFDLRKAQRDEVEKLRKELSGLETDFDANISKAEHKLIFTKAELEGVPQDFLDQPDVKTTNGTYAVMANITWHYLTVMENAKSEATRLKMRIARDNLARETNIPLLQRMLVVRDNLAHLLGYATWADYQTEVKMAKTGARAMEFLQNLEEGIEPKYEAELAELRAMKVRETHNTNAVFNLWDWPYYVNQLKKEKYTVDEEALRVYFPYEKVLQGMFDIYQRIFGLKFQEIEAPYKWVPDLQLYAVTDAKTGEPMGLFYLDMFPREGKFNHFAQFDIITGKLLPDGKYQRPTVALICNFPTPEPGKPSLMAHDDVVTIFHEFGHAMHSILTRAKYSRFAGTAVPRDFVEAPSQMLENWAWDKRVLDSFAADYRDPSKKIPAEVLGKLREADLATYGSYYRRQLSFALTDMELHTQIHEGNEQDVVPLSNKVASEVFLPVAPDTAFVAYFGHLVGYDAGYYGYAWADAIAADMATVFQNAPDGYFDRDAGLRLRKEIYEQGGARDVEISVEKFLGRPESIAPFLQRFGITNGVNGKL